MIVFLTLIHIVICLFLIIVVLLQSGKAADLAGAFGGMGSQTAFGPRGSATVLSKATTVAAALFVITSMTLTILGSRTSGGSSTVLESEGSQATQPAPAVPSPVTPGGPPAAGQPSVTVTNPATGESKTMPIEIPAPSEQPAEGQSAPETPNNQ